MDFVDVDSDSHIYMGWAIFLLVITLLFWLGRRYEDEHIEPAGNDESITTAMTDPESSRRVDLAAASAIVLVLLAAGPALLDISRDRMSVSQSQPSLPVAGDGWSGPRDVTLGYRPAFASVGDSVAGQYLNDRQPVKLHIVFYSEQQQGNELVVWQNKLFHPDGWCRIRRGYDTVTVPVTGEQLPVRTLLTNNGRQLLQLWYWYDIRGALTSGPRVAKVRQAWNAIIGNRQCDALVVLATPVEYLEATDDLEPLHAFIGDHLYSLKTCLRPAADEPRRCATGSKHERASGQ